MSKAGEKPKRDQNDKRERPQRNKEDHPHREYNDTNKIMVTKLNWKTTDEGLKEAFSKFGDIEECVVFTDRRTHKSRGMGVVRFATEEAMKKSIEEMNNKVRVFVVSDV